MNQTQSSLLKQEPETMAFWDIIKQHESLSRSIPLLDNEQKEVVIADFVAISNQRSLKFDELFLELKEWERSTEYYKETIKELTKSKKHSENVIKDLKTSLREIRRMLPEGKEHDVINGKHFQFRITPITSGQNYGLTVVPLKDISEFSPIDKAKFWIKKEITITEETVITSIEGEILSKTSTPKTTSEFILNEDAVINAYKNNGLPNGIKVIQNYRITRRTICPNVDVETSSHTTQFLRESASSN